MYITFTAISRSSSTRDTNLRITVNCKKLQQMEVYNYGGGCPRVLIQYSKKNICVYDITNETAAFLNQLIWN